MAKTKSKQYKFKSGFEKLIADQIMKHEGEVTYEPDRFGIWQLHSYTPDFRLKNGRYIEGKGRFTSAKRTQAIAFKKAYPSIELRFLFQRDNTLNKKSKTRYSKWCEQHGFKYAIGTIPDDWYAPVITDGEIDLNGN